METVTEMVRMHLKNNSPRKCPKIQSTNHANGPNLDSLRILEPTRKKLSTVETQRIMAVLTDCTQKVELVALMPNIIQYLERFKTSLGSSLAALLEKHQVLVESFEEIKTETSSLLAEQGTSSEDAYSGSGKSGHTGLGILTEEEESESDRVCGTVSSDGESRSDLSTKSSSFQSNRTEMAVKNLQVVAGEIQDSIKTILRALQKNPTSSNVIETLLKQNCQRDVQTERFLTVLQKLRDIVMSKLLMSSAEEERKNKYLRDVFKRERRNSQVIQRLSTNLNAANQEMQQCIGKKNEAIKVLQDSLEQVEHQADEQMRRTRAEAEKQILIDLSASETKLARMEIEHTTLKTQLTNMVAEHREIESDLRKRKFKLESEVENWMHKYDADMGVRQTELEEISEVYTKEKEELKELEEAFNELNKDYTQIVEERKQKREAEIQAGRRLKECIIAARVIQRFWRRYGTKKGGKKKKKNKKK